MLLNFLLTIQFILVISIVVLVFLQKPPEDGFAGFGGGMSNEGGYKKQMQGMTGIKKFTLYVGLLFMLNSFLIVKYRMIQHQKNSILTQISKEQSKKEIDFDVNLD